MQVRLCTYSAYISTCKYLSDDIVSSSNRDYVHTNSQLGLEAAHLILDQQLLFLRDRMDSKSASNLRKVCIRIATPSDLMWQLTDALAQPLRNCCCVAVRSEKKQAIA